VPPTTSHAVDAPIVRHPWTDATPAIAARREIALLLTDIQMPAHADGNLVADAARRRHPGGEGMA